jgi:hypothetical protein
LQFKVREFLRALQTADPDSGPRNFLFTFCDRIEIELIVATSNSNEIQRRKAIIDCGVNIRKKAVESNK